jgi:acetyl-CoA acyltransferase
MSEVFIVGVGMTPFGRHPQQTVKQLTAWAVNDALRDAGCKPSDIEGAFFGCVAQGYMAGQISIGGQIALLPLGIEGVPIYNVENACATASSAFHLGVDRIRAGSADVVLAVGVDKIHSSDKAKMFGFFEAGWDLETVEQNRERLVALGKGVEVPAGTTSDKPYSVFMDVYAAFGRQIMREYGITQRQIATAAAKNHDHSVHNPRAQYRAGMTTDEVLKAAPITYPLTLPMCSPISDGAAAAVLCSAAGLKRLGLDRSRAVRVRASVMRSASARTGDDLQRHITRRAADAAYEAAGVSPADVHVAEVHDATSIGELIQVENLRLAAPGESGIATERGDTRVGGRIPVNPSGGLVSKGHPVGATGLGQIFELVSQLRGECGPRQVEGARIAVHENGGGLWGVEEAAAHVGILERV